MPQITLDFPAGSISNGLISSSANIAASKAIRHQSIDVELFGPSTTVTALTKDIHIVRGSAGTLVGIEGVICGAIATGADRTIAVDLQKSTGAGAFATVLSSTVDFSNVSVLRTAVAGVLNSTALLDGDILRLVVTVAGSASAQATGLLVTVTLEEKYA
jgi:hypothetical protein